jgi:tetratricopeptide (TPR) repeat protein
LKGPNPGLRGLFGTIFFTLNPSFMKKNSIHYDALKTKFGWAVISLFIVTVLLALDLYVTAVPKRLFTTNFRPYEMPVMRGASALSVLKEAYAKGKMDSVIGDFKSNNAPVPEEYLLTGIAFLEKNQPDKAIETFKILIEKNKASNSDFFEEDAEYYLAMSYLSNNEPAKAMPIFEKIQSEPDHAYYSNVSDWFMLNLKTSIVKNK